MCRRRAPAALFPPGGGGGTLCKSNKPFAISASVGKILLDRWLTPSRLQTGFLLWGNRRLLKRRKKRTFRRSPNKRASGGLPKYTDALCKQALLTGGNRKAGRGAAPGSQTGAAALICLKVVGILHRRATKACSANTEPVGHRARKRQRGPIFPLPKVRKKVK